MTPLGGASRGRQIYIQEREGGFARPAGKAGCQCSYENISQEGLLRQAQNHEDEEVSKASKTEPGKQVPSTHPTRTVSPEVSEDETSKSHVTQ